MELHGDNIAIKIVDGVLICATIMCSFAYVIDRICMQKSITWEDIFVVPFRKKVIWINNHLRCVTCLAVFIVLSSVVIYLVIRKFV